MLLGREQERRAIERRARAGAVGRERDAGAGRRAGDRQDRAARPRRRRARAGMQLLRARGIESEAQIPFASLFELLRPGARRCSSRSRRPRRPRSRARSRSGPATGPGALRGRRRDAQPARRVRRAGPGGRADRRRALARRLERPGAAVRVPAAARRPDRGADRRPRGRAVAARRRRPADAAARRADAARRRPSCCPALGIGGRASGCTRATGGNPLALLELADGGRASSRSLPTVPRCSSRPRISRRLRAPRGTRSSRRRAACWCWPPPATRGDLAHAGAAPRREARTSSSRRSPAPRRAGLVSLHAGRGRVPPPARALGGLRAGAGRRAPRRAPRARRPRCPTATSTAARGTSPRRPSAPTTRPRRRSSRPARAPATAARTRARRRAFERGGAAGHRTPERRARLLLGGGRGGWLAGPRRRASRCSTRRARQTDDPALIARIEQLAGHIAIARGPVMRGHAILTAAAERAEPEQAVAMLVRGVPWPASTPGTRAR